MWNFAALLRNKMRANPGAPTAWKPAQAPSFDNTFPPQASPSLLFTPLNMLRFLLANGMSSDGASSILAQFGASRSSPLQSRSFLTSGASGGSVTEHTQQRAISHDHGLAIGTNNTTTAIVMPTSGGQVMTNSNSVETSHTLPIHRGQARNFLTSGASGGSVTVQIQQYAISHRQAARLNNTTTASVVSASTGQVPTYLD